MIRARTPDQLDRLETSWRALHTDCRLPSGHFGWARAWLSAFAEDAAFEVVSVVQSGHLAGVVPLVHKRRHGVARVFMLGVGPMAEPVDLVAADETVRRRLAESIAARPLVVARIPDDSSTIQAIRRACRGRAIVAVRPAAPYPYIPLDESWIEPEQHLNAYCRGQLRHARLQAEQFGPLAIEIHTPGLHELPELLDAAFAVEARGNEPRTVRAQTLDPRRAVFYRQCALAACLDGTLRISLLRIGETIAAVEVAIESGGGYWLLMAAEDDRFSSCLPGQLLARQAIRYAAEANLTTYAFWGRPRHWTAAWTTHKQECVSIYTYPVSVGGLAALVADGVLGGYKKWRSFGDGLAYPASQAGR